jgi:IS5 family transposase
MQGITDYSSKSGIFSMLTTQPSNLQMGFFSSFRDILDRKYTLYLLTHEVLWQIFETIFSTHYSLGNGRLAKPIRQMADQLMLKHIRNISDQSEVEQ